MDDLAPLPGIAEAAIVRSPYPHGRIRSVDTSQAMAIDGVLAVVTGAEMAEMSAPFLSVLDQPIEYRAAALDTVRYVGEPVAVVVAKDRYIAEDGVEAVVVDYEPLEAVTSPGMALDPSSPVLHPGVGSNVVSDRSFSYGNPEEAFAKADLVVSASTSHPRSTCLPLECYGVICDWNSFDSSVTAWSNFQGPFTVHGLAANALGIPASKLRLITPPNSGGSFGIKAAIYVYVVLIALASKRAGVPVRWMEDRVEHLLGSSCSSERLSVLDGAFSADGELLGLRWDMVDDVGAYVRAPEPATIYRMHGCLGGAYRVRNVSVRARVVVTNRLPTGLNRGFGGPQLYFPLERMMMMAAKRLGVDPVDLARKNLIAGSGMPYRTPSGSLYDSGDYPACLERAVELSRYEAARRRQEEARKAGRLVGIGLACVVEPSVSNMGYITLASPASERAGDLPKSGNVETASVVMGPHGGVTVRCTTTPQGQGHATVLAQVVADALGVEIDAVDVRTDADTASNCWTVSSGNYSSRFAAMGTSAAHLAASRLAEQLRAIAAQHLGVKPCEVTLNGGRAYVALEPSRSVSIRRLAGAAHWDPAGLPAGTDPGLAVTATFSMPGLEAPNPSDEVNASGAYGFVVDIAEVEVHPDTGRVEVLSYSTVHDAGTLLNPMLAEGQVHGAIAHGIGAALLEAHGYDSTGTPLTSSLLDYLALTATDAVRASTAFLEFASPLTPLGAKGLGEGNTMSAPVALANAVADAIGVDEIELPLTPARVWAMCNRA